MLPEFLLLPVVTVVWITVSTSLSLDPDASSVASKMLHQLPLPPSAIWATSEIVTPCPSSWWEVLVVEWESFNINHPYEKRHRSLCIGQTYQASSTKHLQYPSTSSTVKCITTVFCPPAPVFFAPSEHTHTLSCFIRSHPNGTVDKPWINRGTLVYFRGTDVYCRGTAVSCRGFGYSTLKND